MNTHNSRLVVEGAVSVFVWTRVDPALETVFINADLLGDVDINCRVDWQQVLRHDHEVEQGLIKSNRGFRPHLCIDKISRLLGPHFKEVKWFLLVDSRDFETVHVPYLHVKRVRRLSALRILQVLELEAELCVGRDKLLAWVEFNGDLDPVKSFQHAV